MAGGLCAMLVMPARCPNLSQPLEGWDIGFLNKISWLEVSVPTSQPSRPLPKYIQGMYFPPIPISAE